MTRSARLDLVGFGFGVIFGFILAAARLTDYDVVHRMLLFRDWEPFLVMGSAVVVAAPLLRLMLRRGWETPLGGKLAVDTTPVGRRHGLGAIVFGSGWAVSGTCAGPAVAMVGSGHVLGLVVVAGLFAGIVARDSLVARASLKGLPVPTAAAESTRVGL